MSVRNRMTTNVYGDPVLTITVEGTHDVYRLALHLERGQVEFAKQGRNVLTKLRRHLGKARMRSLIDYYSGRTWKREAS